MHQLKNQEIYEEFINLDQILNGSFRFYLNDNFRNQIFSQLKNTYDDWRIVAQKLNMDVRHLFGIRRGFEYVNGKRVKKFISGKYILSIQKLVKINLRKFGNNIITIKLGTSGMKESLRFPIKVNLKDEPINTVKRALGEFLFRKKFEKNINLNYLPVNFIKKDNYLGYRIKITKNKINELRLRGLRPSLRENSDIYIIKYRNPGTNNFVEKTIPKKIIFNEIFAKEIGKWLGDRCGGRNKVGVANKEIEFILEFNDFLKNQLKQPSNNIEMELTCRKDFMPSEDMKLNVRNIRYAKTQLGKFAYRVEVANKLLRNLVFDLIENNIFNLLYNSKSFVRFAFYAGFFEAEGSVLKKSKNLTFSFGFNLSKEKSNKEILTLYQKVLKLNYLLSQDGFNPQISRKVGNTQKSKTLKYDIKLLCSQKNRQKEVNFIKETIFKYLTHKKKIKRFLELETTIKQNN